MDSQPKRCVIADDVRASRMILQKWMEELGFDCTLVSDGVEAEEVLKDGSADLVITDIEMPRMSGLELLRSVRADQQSQIADVPVIVVSSLEDAQMDSVIEKLGGTGFFGKPLDKDQLHRAVRKIEAGCRDLREISIRRADHRKPLSITPTLRRLAQKAIEPKDSDD